MKRSKRHFFVVFFTVLTWICGIALPTLCFAETSVNAFIEMEFAYGIDKPSWRKAETIIDLEIEGAVASDIDYTIVPRIRIDFDNNLSNFDSRPLNYSSWNGPIDHDHHVVAELFEGYLEIDLDESHWIIGKQQVVWGEADGIKLLDIINPQDLREINLDNFDDSRIPTWMINAEFNLPLFEESSLQFVLIPDMTFNLIPGNNTEFGRRITNVPPPSDLGQSKSQSDMLFTQNLTPELPSGEWEVGLRWNLFIEGWDLSFIWFNHYHDLPVSFTEFDSQKSILLPAPKYQRNNLYGMTASSAFGDWVIRGEFAYQSNRFYSSTNQILRAIHETSELNTIIGFDFHGFKNAYASYQLFAGYLNQYNDDVMRDRLLTRHTFLYQQNLWNDVLTLEGFVLFDQQDEDGELRGKIYYQYDDSLTIWAGFDVFYGKSRGRFGRFKDNDRLVVGFQYGL